MGLIASLGINLDAVCSQPKTLDDKLAVHCFSFFLLMLSESEVASFTYFFLKPVILKHVEQKKICSS